MEFSQFCFVSSKLFNLIMQFYFPTWNRIPPDTKCPPNHNYIFKKLVEQRFSYVTQHLFFPNSNTVVWQLKKYFLFLNNIIIYWIWNKLWCIPTLQVFEDNQGFLKKWRSRLHISDLILLLMVDQLVNKNSVSWGVTTWIGAKCQK